jgi:hypothetical protein
MHVSLWWVPRARLPALPPVLTRAVRPVTVAGRGVIGTAWVEYEPGGDMHYRELLSAVLVRHRARLRVCIVDIWVDSLASRDGGRELWGIPKDLATFVLERDEHRGALAPRAETTGDRGATALIAQASIGARRRVPGRWPVGFSIVQQLDDQVKTTPVRGRAAPGPASATWQVPPSGPLTYLAGRRPWLTVTLRDFRLTFGRV